MRRSIRFELFLILSISLGLPSASFAGPIEWSYTSSFHAVGQPGVPFVYVGGGGTGTDGTYVLGAALHGLNELGYPNNPGVGSPITVGHFEIAQFNAAYQSPPTTQKNFELDVIIADGASGQRGTAAFFGSGSTVLTENWPPNPMSLHFVGDELQPTVLGRYGTSQSLVLGKNRYDLEVSSTTAAWGGNGDVVAAVSISPLATPEPATFALAGIGLVGLMGWRWKR